MRLIDADGSYTLNASDNTDYSLCFGGGIISVIDKHGHIACEFFADDAPTIDAEPVRHGRWIEAHDNDGLDYECSNQKCKCRISYNGAKVSGDFNYCPNCGAKMDEEAGK